MPFVGVGDTALGLFDVEHPFSKVHQAKASITSLLQVTIQAWTLSVFGTQATPSDGIDGRTQVQLARELTRGYKSG